MVIEIENGGVELCGDVFFRLLNAKNKELICRWAINTSFIKDNKHSFNKKGVDPDSIQGNKKYDSRFAIDLYF